MSIKVRTYDSKSTDLNTWRREQKEKYKAAKDALQEARDRLEEARSKHHNVSNDPNATREEIKKAQIRFEMAALNEAMAEGDLEKLDFMSQWEEHRRFQEADLNTFKEQLRNL